eukprot:COSAG01_NODE_7718_length_3085_cov_2.157066_1_plen_165_part_00
MVREKLRGRLQGGAGGLQRAFKFFDRDGSGCVSRAEFTKTMQVNLGLNFEPRLMQQVFAAFDPDSTGEIDFPRFTAVVMESSGSALSAGTSLSTSTASLQVSSDATGNSEMFLVRRAGRSPRPESVVHAADSTAMPRHAAPVPVTTQLSVERGVLSVERGVLCK